MRVRRAARQRGKRCSQQLANRRAVLEEVLRAAVVVGQLRRARVDAELVVKRGEELLEMDRPVDGMLAERVRGADRLASRLP